MRELSVQQRIHVYIILSTQTCKPDHIEQALYAPDMHSNAHSHGACIMLHGRVFRLSAMAHHAKPASRITIPGRPGCMSQPNAKYPHKACIMHHDTWQAGMYVPAQRQIPCCLVRLSAMAHHTQPVSHITIPGRPGCTSQPTVKYHAGCSDSDSLLWLTTQSLHHDPGRVAFLSHGIRLLHLLAFDADGGRPL